MLSVNPPNAFKYSRPLDRDFVSSYQLLSCFVAPMLLWLCPVSLDFFVSTYVNYVYEVDLHVVTKEDSTISVNRNVKPRTGNQLTFWQQHDQPNEHRGHRVGPALHGSGERQQRKCRHQLRVPGVWKKKPSHQNWHRGMWDGTRVITRPSSGRAV